MASAVLTVATHRALDVPAVTVVRQTSKKDFHVKSYLVISVFFCIEALYENGVFDFT